VNVQNERLGYPIVIAHDVRANLREALRARGGRFVILYDAQPAVASLARSLASGASAAIPVRLGERRKTFATLEVVLDALARAGAERSTVVVGVGGGVAADIFGLASALYARGTPYFHVATSLVAMVDAAIGGKTGVDLAAGKNLAGAFRNPAGVFAHVDALRTLPYRRLREGLAEVVKAGIIVGGDLFESLEVLAAHPFSRWPWLELVAAAVDVKASVVERDPREEGERALLNLGHTFAHAYERASGYRIAHGAAVALGLRAAGLLAQRVTRFSQRDHLRVLALLALLEMPLRTSVEPRAAMAAMASDKKRRGRRQRFVLARRIGDVLYDCEAPRSAVLEVLALMRRAPSDRG
jgi:3-dehydroquinate synthetase